MTECSEARFVVLEGLDGVGKSTLARGLAAYTDGVMMSTPGKQFNEIRHEILNEFGDDQLARALFFCATVSSQGRQAQQIVSSGHSVYMDRYWPSTVAYAKARGVNTDLDSLDAEIVRPDHVVLIVIDENERLDRLRKRGMTAEDDETLSTEFSACVSRELEERCSMQFDITGYDENSAVVRLAEVLYEN